MKKTSRKVLTTVMVCTILIQASLVGFNCQGAQSVQADGTLHNSVYTAGSVVVGDNVTFGSYPQSDSTGVVKEPIYWRVLSINGDDMFLLSNRNLDTCHYSLEQGQTNWSASYVRKWLNEEFLNAAFSGEEQEAIIPTLIKNSEFTFYEMKFGGADTTDKVYLLSVKEACNPDYGFISEPEVPTSKRYAKNTNYAIERGTGTDGPDTVETEITETYGNGPWKLRSIGYQGRCAAFVRPDGFVNSAGRQTTIGGEGIRPVIHVKLSSNLWENVGTNVEPPIWTPVPTANTTVTPSMGGSTPVPTATPDEALTPSPSSTPSTPTVLKVKVPIIKSVQAKKKAAKVIYKRVSKASGYELQYSKSKKFSSVKKIVIKNNKNTSKVIKKLKSKCSYYIRMRTFHIHEGEKVRSNWSKAKKVKVK